MICWKCGKENNIDSVFRNTECSSCHADLHCCKGCKFYAPGSHYDCRESVDSLVSDKEKANFCDFFQYFFILALFCIQSKTLHNIYDFALKK